MTDNENKYWAFLSFSDRDNRERRSDTPDVVHRCWGDWLHDALKTFSIPAEFAGQINGLGEIIPERIDPIFRDERELPENATLSAEIREALEQSVCLIVICSPRSAQSRHVNEAVRYFKQLGRGQQHILPIVIAGEPNASDGNNPGISPEDECFVPALRHPVSPDGTIDTTQRAGRCVFVDARQGVEKREILANDQRNAEADLEMAKIQLIALLLGVGFNGLWWREQKRHYFDLTEAQRQAREALNQVAEVRRQLEAAQRQTREAQTRALENQNLPRDVHGQIQEAQSQVVAAQNQAREAEKQLQEFQSKVRETQIQLEATRDRATAAEGKVLEAQNQAREAQNQLEETRRQAREAQDKVLEMPTPPPDVSNEIQEAQIRVLEAQKQAQITQSQLEETRNQVRDAQDKFLEAQSRVQEFQNQARSAQSQLEEARERTLAAENKVLEAQNQAREAQNKVEEIQNLTRDAQSQIQAAENQVRKIKNQDRNARRLIRVFAVLAVLAMLAAGVAARQALQQRRVASQALAQTAAEADGNFDLAAGGLGQEQIRQTLQKIGGAEQAENRRRSLDRLAASIPRAGIPEALKASADIMDDQQRSHFQKWLLLRLGWANPVSAMTCADAIAGKIVNEEGLNDSSLYFQLAVLDNWMQTDLSGAFGWVCQLPDADARQRALAQIIRWVQSQPDSEAKHNALAKCIGELSKTDVSGALALTESLPEGAWRDTVMARLWMRADPFSVWEWINRLNLPPEIMQPRNAPWPWTKFLLNVNLGSLTIFPIETDFLSNATNGPVQIKPPE